MFYHTTLPRRGQQKRHPAMAGVLGIVGYFRGIFSAAHVRYPLDEHERLACRLGRPLGQVPAAPSHGLCRSAGKLPSQSRLRRASSPEGRAKSRLPLWGRCPPREGGEGTPLARGPAFGKPPSWHSTVRERRGKAPVSLAFFRLPPIKVKGKVEAFLKKSFTKKLYVSPR